MDPLSSLFRVLKIRSYGAAGLDAGGEWAIRFPPHEGMKVFAVVHGSCRVSIEGGETPVGLRAGECFLATQGRAFRLGNNAAVEAASVETLYPPAFDGRVVTYNGGGDFLAVGGFFSLADRQADLFLKSVPPVIRFHKGRDRDAMRECVDRLSAELREPGLGTKIIAEQLVMMMLLHALRSSTPPADGMRSGWLAAIADPKLERAISAMHKEPDQKWTIQSLAAVAGMSRTSFALRFRAVVGSAPLEYLTRWRMLLAKERLTTSKEPAGEIGLAIGYDCERSFARAFKRENGVSPRQYRWMAQGWHRTDII